MCNRSVHEADANSHRLRRAFRPRHVVPELGTLVTDDDHALGGRVAMTTIVMGGGLIGITTAYYLAKSGHDVTVLERNEGAGEETSFQNGALLAPGHSQSWAAPGAAWTLVKSLFQKDPALKFRFSTDPQFWRWGMKFLSNCTHDSYRKNTLRVFRCMNEGLAELRALSAETGISYEGNDNGILYLFRSERSLEERSGDWTLLRDHGLKLEKASVERCAEIEPVLEPVKSKIAGGFFSPDEEAGDAYLFTCRLAEHCVELGVNFKYSTAVSDITVDNGKVTAVNTDRGQFTADRYLLALGPHSPVLARRIGIELPIWPVKGYTASIPINGHNGAPKVGVIEEDNLVAFANLGDRLRVGGKAEFAGYDRSFTEPDFEGVFSVSKELFPNAGDYEQPKHWACLRPTSAGGPPILGETPLRNLYLNVGHGAAGWTMGCATSRAVADVMTGRKPDLDMEGLKLADL
jgi:D-amino-acid dehydrogenase